jgi:CubicO group peptidase (beta-lactamase class C family)
MRRKRILALVGVTLGIIVIGILVWLRLNVWGFFAPGCIRPNPPFGSVDAFDACVAEVVEMHGSPSMAVALVTPGGVMWSKGYGYANIEEGRAATPDTPYLLSSIAKTFIGTAVMQQVEAGRLDLDEDINTYLPFTVDNPRVEGEVITLRHLATHTSGLIDNYEDVYDPTYVPGDSPVVLPDFLEGYYVPGGEYYYAEDNFSECMPGECYQYSNIAASLGAYIVELVSGEPFNDYVENHILGPLGVEDAHYFLTDYADPTVIAMPYEPDEEGVLEPYGYYGYPTYPDGHLYISANGLGTYLAAIMNDGELNGARILEAGSVAEMLTSQDVDFGFNLLGYIFNGKPGQTVYWETLWGMVGHTGGDFGSATVMFFEPEHKVGVVMLTNYADSDSMLSMLRIVQHVDVNSEHMAAWLSE